MTADQRAPYSYRDQDLDLLTRYLTEIRGTPLLTAAQEVELAKRMEAGIYAAHLLECETGLSAERTADLRAVVRDGAAAKDHMIRANLRFVVSMARKYRRRGVALLDAIQDGNLGLIRAVERFDYAKGYKFSTYAIWWIRQFIDHGLARMSRAVRLPIYVAEEFDRFARIEGEMAMALGRDPTAEEVAEESGQPPGKVAEYRRITRGFLSLDMPTGPHDGSLAEILFDGEGENEQSAVESAMVAGQLRSLVAALPPREAMVISWRFGLDGGDPRSLQRIGDQLGLTRERVRQLQNRALSRLREPAQIATLA